MGDLLGASYGYHLDDIQKKCRDSRNYQKAEGSVGGQYGADPQITTKSRLNKSGKLAVFLQHELKPKSILTISAKVDIKVLDRTSKFGLVLALKP